MGRQGDDAERWVAECTTIQATANSGAVHEDGDGYAGGYGGRVYEVKSSSVRKDILIRGLDVKKLLQREKKLSRDGIFLYRNVDKRWFAIVRLATLGKHDFLLLDHVYKPKVKSISIPFDIVEDMIDNDFVILINKCDHWAILDAETWLRHIGDWND